MLTLTLFPVLNRLMHDPGDDPDLARRISESFVDDMDAVFREMGVSDPGDPEAHEGALRRIRGADHRLSGGTGRGRLRPRGRHRPQCLPGNAGRTSG